jgi:hypothetical protein
MLSVMVLVAGGMRRTQDISGWPQVSGQMETLSYGPIENKWRVFAPKLTYAVGASFVYEVDGVEYLSSTVSQTGNPVFNTSDESREFLDEITSSGLMVYFNPDDPSEAYLYYEEVGFGLLIMGLGGLGMLIALVGLSRRRKEVD